MIATILPIDRAGTYGVGPPGVPASADEDKILLLPSGPRKGRTPHYPFGHKPGLAGARTILNIFKRGYRRWTMPEIRKDYATPTWVVFSAARSQRPGAFRNPRDATPRESCPFCEGHESMTPPEVLAYRERGPADGPGWSIRCVPNKFPALERVGEVREHRDGPFVSVDGVGMHEIVVESPDHDGHLATLDDRQIERVLRAYREVSRPRRGPPNQVRPDLQESRRTSRR